MVNRNLQEGGLSMNKFIKFIFMSWAIFLFFSIKGLLAAEANKKAETIDELVKMYDSTSCKACHKTIYETWEKSLHAISLIGTPRTMATMKNWLTDALMKEWKYSGVKSVEDIKVEHMMTCFKCHLPQMKDATDKVAQEIAKAIINMDEDTLKKVNINCIVCHNMKALTHKWVDGEIEANTVYGPSGVAGIHPDYGYQKVKHSPIIKEAIHCGQCHGLGPNFELPQPTQCATLYGSYLHAYVPAGGDKTCQQCHISDMEILQGFYIKDHRMPSYRYPLHAQKAFELVVEAKAYKFLYAAGNSIPKVDLKVKIFNKAGHRIPDG